MDRDKFDQHLMDYLFDELDEVTTAAMKRKIESDAECRELEAGLRATLEVAQVPMEDPSDDLESRILAAARLAEHGEPFSQKLLRALSWAGSHAMRPQLAMAALLMMVLGSSVLLLRARPGSVAVTPKKEVPTVAVANPDETVPEAPAAEASAEPTAVAQNDAPPTAPATPRAEGTIAPGEAELDEIFDRGVSSFRAGKHAEAQRDLALVAASGSAKASQAALYEAKAVRAASGCSQAVAKYRAIRVRYAGSAVAADAAWAEADCLWQMGQTAQANAILRTLLNNQAYADRAAKELVLRGEAASSGGNAISSKRRAAPAPRPAAPKPAAAPPNADTF